MAIAPIALRVDVDTVRGTRDGLPRLLRILEARGICATWYVTLGPDNMGRHAWRLLRPAFFLKMMRSQPRRCMDTTFYFAARCGQAP